MNKIGKRANRPTCSITAKIDQLQTQVNNDNQQ
jgi:hypothetical protein